MAKKQELILDSVLHEKIRKSQERISENLHILANEPSLAFYRLQENTRKSMPHIIERRVEAEKLHHELQGSYYDVDYAIEEIKMMKNTADTFKNILELSNTALFMKQQLNYLKNKRRKKDTSSSVYKRLSAHITLDLPDALKETASKVESMVNNSRHSTMY